MAVDTPFLEEKMKQQPQQQPQNQADTIKQSLIYFFSIFVPIIGLICAVIFWRKQRPMAERCLVLALIGLVIALTSTLLFSKH